MLNQSISIDYATCNCGQILAAAGYDDIDSFAGLIYEKITGQNVVDADDSDENNPGENGMEKYEPSPLYFEQISHHHFAYNLNNATAGMTGMELANKISKGHINIISPPPEL